MNFEKLYKMQSKLDEHILNNNYMRNGEKINKTELLEKTILALLVEVGELANATRCFKHWSTKGPMSRLVIIDELADVWHFYLSLGNQSGVFYGSEKNYRSLETGESLTDVLLDIYGHTVLMKGVFNNWNYNYLKLGQNLMKLNTNLGFTSKEVELAYNRKHEENYKRQATGY